MSITFGSAVISKNPSFGTRWAESRPSQRTRIAVDGTRTTYDAAPNILRGVVSLRNVSHAEGDTLWSYITDTAVYGLNSFTIDISGLTYTDLGAGAATNITSAYWNGETSLEEWFELIAPDNWNIRFPYWKKL